MWLTHWRRVKSRLHIKREYPAIYAIASSWVAIPLIGLVASFYVVRAISRPASEVYAIGIGAFGLTAGLSAICFSVPETVGGAANFRYSGEKFLHSSVLIIQTVMVVYLKDVLVASSWLGNHPWIAKPTTSIPTMLLPILSGAAAITWHHGFEALDAQLWRNWKVRIERLNAHRESQAADERGDQKDRS